MEIFKDNLVSSENPQESIRADKKIKTTKIPLIAFPNEGNIFEYSI